MVVASPKLGDEDFLGKKNGEADLKVVEAEARAIAAEVVLFQLLERDLDRIEVLACFDSIDERNAIVKGKRRHPAVQPSQHLVPPRTPCGLLWSCPASAPSSRRHARRRPVQRRAPRAH